MPVYAQSGACDSLRALAKTSSRCPSRGPLFSNSQVYREASQGNSALQAKNLRQLCSTVYSVTSWLPTRIRRDPWVISESSTIALRVRQRLRTSFSSTGSLTSQLVARSLQSSLESCQRAWVFPPSRLSVAPQGQDQHRSPRRGHQEAAIQGVQKRLILPWISQISLQLLGCTCYPGSKATAAGHCTAAQACRIADQALLLAYC